MVRQKRIRTLTGVENHPKIQLIRRREIRGRQSGVSRWCTRRRRRKEKSLREPVRGGTGVAALSHSLIESAKLAGVEPRAYLPEAARRAIRNSGTVTLARYLK
jgi:hypothetical protein